MDLARGQDLLLGIVEVVADEDRSVLLSQVAPGQSLERKQEREAHLTTLGDPAEAGAVLQERDLVGLQHEGLVIEGAEAAKEASLLGQPLGEPLLGPFDDAERHGAAPSRTAFRLAFPAVERLHVSVTSDRQEVMS